ncbi:MAG: hypothetical protein GDA44_15495 [Prochloron sp. SP5CPC1]|nr:hypothetical protein [Candidatus Paraprochloron terpiosi SP5CPC1]
MPSAEVLLVIVIRLLFPGADESFTLLASKRAELEPEIQADKQGISLTKLRSQAGDRTGELARISDFMSQPNLRSYEATRLHYVPASM